MCGSIGVVGCCGEGGDRSSSSRRGQKRGMETCDWIGMETFD